MSSGAYYNENDSQKAAWIRELIKAGLVTPGEVDERSITDVQPDDLRGYNQCHFFAGIAVWSYALRLAGWPDSRRCWTGSCPCPSFSAAGKGGGFDDPRHLWPDWFRLIRECKPAVIFGEQADDAIGYGWLDLVQTDLESSAYAVGKAVLGACSVGAPHIRQRLYFVADARIHKSGALGVVPRKDGEATPRTVRTNHDATLLGRGGEVGIVADAEHSERRAEREEHTDAYGRDGLGGSGDAISLDDSASPRCDGARLGAETETRDEARLCGPECGCATGELGGTDEPGSQGQQQFLGSSGSELPAREAGFINGFWADAEWIPCRNPKVPGAIDWRPIKPGTFPLAARTPARVLRLRGYGDGIVAQVAVAFIESYCG